MQFNNEFVNLMKLNEFVNLQIAHQKENHRKPNEENAKKTSNDLK